MKHRGYTIEPAPSYTRSAYQFVHDDYDPTPQDSYGPPGDNRCGVAKSIEDAIAQIDEMEDER